MDRNREIDRLVAEKVMGYTVYHYEDYAENNFYRLMDEYWNLVLLSPGLENGKRKTEGQAWEDVPRYSTDIADAWLVVEKMRLSILRLPDGHWLSGKIQAGTYLDPALGTIDGYLDDHDQADNAPLAICLAALKAVGVEVKEKAEHTH